MNVNLKNALFKVAEDTTQFSAPALGYTALGLAANPVAV
jgi:hypothetical protein